MPNSKRKYDVLRDVHEPVSTSPEALVTPETPVDRRRSVENRNMYSMRSSMER